MIYTTDINNVFVNRKTMVYYTLIIFLAPLLEDDKIMHNNNLVGL